MKKYILLIFVILSVFANLNAAPQKYWEKIKTIPAPYDKNYWLDVYIYPSDSNYIWISGYNGMTIHSTDYGKTWSGSQISGVGLLESIKFVTKNTGYVSGPDGIFKSVDGGTTWQDISPDPGSTYWGNLFLDINTVFVLSEGCGTKKPRFYKTTDGGLNWTFFEGNPPFESGLTDALFLPDGTGYAVSSGAVWRTTNIGDSWELFSTTGPNYWQEALSYHNGHIAVPVAGFNCSGGGARGEIRTSTDDGATWRSFPTKDAMFGVAFLNESEGWAVGVDRQAYYTNNGGASWNLYNCGVDYHLDDCNYYNKNVIWAVGIGVYKLSPASAKTDVDSLNMGVSCIPGTQLDTLYISNLSFNDALLELNLTGADAGEFSIVEPSAFQWPVSYCDVTPVIVAFTPTTPGQKTAYIHYKMNNIDTSLKIIAKATKQTIRGLDTDTTLKSVYVNKDEYLLTRYLAEFPDKIDSCVVVNYDPGVSCKSNFPFYVNTTDNSMIFHILAQDTGYYSASFKLYSNPCPLDKIQKISYYAYSSIINAKDTNALYFCNGINKIKIPVSNTGNYNLNIDDFIISNSNFKFSSWTSGININKNIIKPGATDTLVLSFTPKDSNFISTKIQFINNDSTKLRGNKNPYNININIAIQNTKLSSSIDTLDFGDVCLTSNKTKTIRVYNSGNITANNIKAKFLKFSGFSFDGYSSSIKAKDSSDIIKITFSPKSLSAFSDTLIFIAMPCYDTTRIVLKGKGVNGDFILTPKNHVLSGKKDDILKTSFNIESKANTTIKISKITLNPVYPDLVYSLLTPLPIYLKPNEIKSIPIQFTSAVGATYNFKLCFVSDSVCEYTDCADLSIDFLNRLIVTEGDLNFETVKCLPNPSVKEIKIINQGDRVDTLTSIELRYGSVGFDVLNRPTLPYYISAGDTLKLNVRFTPSSEKFYVDSLLIKNNDLKIEPLRIPVTGEYKKSIISLSKSNLDFGKFERCSPPPAQIIKIYNTGSLAEKITVSSANIEAFASSYFSNTYDIPAFDSLAIDVSINLPGIKNPGKYLDSITINSLICKSTLLFYLNTELQESNFRISAKDLDFGSVWKDSSKTLQLSIMNKSNEEIIVRSFEISQSDNVYSSNAIFPVTLSGLQTKVLDISYASKKVGDFIGLAKLVFGNTCLDTLFINLKGRTPREIYDVNLKIGDYTANVGDEVKIGISLNSPLPKVKNDSLFVTIAYNKFLFAPGKTYYQSKTGLNEVNFTEYSDSISFRIDYADIFEASGDIIQIDGFALAWTKNYTPIKFNSINLYSPKETVINKTDGSLTTNVICVGDLRGLIQMPTITNSKIFYDNGYININLNIDKDSKIKIDLIGSLGENIINTSNYNIAQGENSIKIPALNISSGIYYIQLENAGWQRLMEKLIIVR